MLPYVKEVRYPKKNINPSLSTDIDRRLLEFQAYPLQRVLR